MCHKKTHTHTFCQHIQGAAGACLHYQQPCGVYRVVFELSGLQRHTDTQTHTEGLGLISLKVSSLLTVRAPSAELTSCLLPPPPTLLSLISVPSPPAAQGCLLVARRERFPGKQSVPGQQRVFSVAGPQALCYPFFLLPLTGVSLTRDGIH